MKNIPNALTIFRISLAPVFIYVYFSKFENHHLIALSVFLLASLTDVLDGYLARKYNVISKLGIALDPLADKIMLLSVLGSFYSDNLIPAIIFFLMLFIESTLIATGALVYFKEDLSVMPSNRLGKSATLAFTFAIVIVFLIPGSALSLAAVILAAMMKTAAFIGYLKNMASIR